MAAQNSANFESKIKRNPHPDFKKVEASRPPFTTDPPAGTFHYVQTPEPNWTFGSGANHLAPAKPQPTSDDASTTTTSKPTHRVIDPYAPTRPAHLNYTLLISTIIPRPICFLSTVSPAGLPNLAPFSYFQMIGHDPPLFIIGFSGSLASPKDSLRNLVETKECVINIIGEDYLEAANACSVNAPYGVSEWEVSGLTMVRDCEVVSKVPRVGEAVFSVEGRLESVREFGSRAVEGKVGTTMAVVEGVRFWVRGDAVDEVGGKVDPAVSFYPSLACLGGVCVWGMGERAC